MSPAECLGSGCPMSEVWVRSVSFGRLFGWRAALDHLPGSVKSADQGRPADQIRAALWVSPRRQGGGDVKSADRWPSPVGGWRSRFLEKWARFLEKRCAVCCVRGGRSCTLRPSSKPPEPLFPYSSNPRKIRRPESRARQSRRKSFLNFQPFFFHPASNPDCGRRRVGL